MKKTQKGITLVALIITVIVIFVLAVVTIIAIRNEDIIAYTNLAKTKYNQSQVKQQYTLNEYSNYLENDDGKNNNNDQPKDPTAPTKIEIIQLTNNKIIVKAVGGTGEKEGYQYSSDGTTWSTTISTTSNYTFETIPEKIYTRTVSGANKFSASASIELISFRIQLDNMENANTYYAVKGSDWHTWVTSSLCTDNLIVCAGKESAVKFNDVHLSYENGNSGSKYQYGNTVILDGGYYSEMDWELGSVPLG